MGDMQGAPLMQGMQYIAQQQLIQKIAEQLTILWLRARLLRLAILLVSTSALCAAVLIILLFLAVVLRLEVSWIISSLFVASMLSLIASLIVFIRDINQSLEALRLDLELHEANGV